MARVDAGPGLDDGQDIGSRHVGKRDVMFGGECQDITPAGDGLSSQEKRGNIILVGLRVVLLLLLLHCAVVVDKGESVLVLWVAVSLGTLIARA